MALVKCPTCHGEGQVYGIGSPGCKAVHLLCDICLGTGTADQELIKRGKKMRKDRLGRGLSLRREAKRLGIDPYLISARERGKALSEKDEAIYQQGVSDALEA